MLESKFFTVMTVLTLLAVAAAFAVQCMEMQHYGIINQLMGK
jgi:hypothetical protein